VNNIISSIAFPYSSDRGSASTTSDGNESSSRNGVDSADPNQSATTLTHVTISTGHSNDSPRHLVPDDVIKFMAYWLKSAKPTLIPGIEEEQIAAQVPAAENYVAVFRSNKGCLLVTLFHRKFGPVLTFGVTPAQADGKELWALLGSKECQPKGAWCGVKFEGGLIRAGASCLMDMMWFGDFERCVAWAWLSICESENELDPQSVQEDVVDHAPIREGAVFDYDASGPRLRIFMPDPTEIEIESIRRGKCQFKLVICGEVIFLMAKFADMHWMDAPYSIHLLPADQRKLCSEFVEGKRYALMVTLIDSRTNLQCGTRLVTWDPHFSAMFHGSVKSQLASRFSEQGYDQTISHTYASMTSSQMCSMARAHTKGGA
jgi:hypothetical protein